MLKQILVGLRSCKRSSLENLEMVRTLLLNSEGGPREGVDVNRAHDEYWQGARGVFYQRFEHDQHVKLMAGSNLRRHMPSGTNILTRLNRRWNALMLAIRNDQTAIARLLIDRPGTNINFRDSQGWSPLLFAIWRNNSEIARVLLGCRDESGRRIVRLNRPSIEGWTPLMLASGFALTEVVEQLLSESDVRNSLTTANGFNALHFASAGGSINIVEALLQRNAALEARTSQGLSPLMIAAEHGREGLLRFFIQRGLDLNLSAKNGRTPLMLAAYAGHLGVVRAILRNPNGNLRTGLNVNKRGSRDGKSAVCLAATRGHWQIIEELARSQARMWFPSNHVRTSLMWAAKNDHLEAVQALLSACSEPSFVNARDGSGNTALMLAVATGYTDIMQALLNAGADCHGALMAAIRRAYHRPSARNRLETVEVLLGVGSTGSHNLRRGVSYQELSEVQGFLQNRDEGDEESFSELSRMIQNTILRMNMREGGAGHLILEKYARENKYPEIVRLLEFCILDPALLKNNAQHAAMIADLNGHEETRNKIEALLQRLLLQLETGDSATKLLSIVTTMIRTMIRAERAWVERQKESIDSRRVRHPEGQPLRRNQEWEWETKSSRRVYIIASQLT